MLIRNSVGKTMQSLDLVARDYTLTRASGGDGDMGQSLRSLNVQKHPLTLLVIKGENKQTVQYYSYPTLKPGQNSFLRTLHLNLV